MAEFGIRNKVAIVTGATQGIGLAIAEDLLNNGAKAVVIIGTNAEKGSEVTKVLNNKYGKQSALFLRADVTKDLDEVFDKVIEKYNYIDILVNNAGIIDENNISRTLNINTIATIEWSLKFLEHMRKDKNGHGGTILNISSIYGFVVDPYFMFYKASKFAVIGFTTSFGHDVNYKITGVRAIVLCPGSTRTDIHDNVAVNTAFKFQNVDITEGRSVQEKENVARAAVQLLMKAETGSVWVADSGRDVKPVLFPDNLL